MRKSSFAHVDDERLKQALEICKIEAANFSRRVILIQREMKRRKKAARGKGD